MQRKKIEPMIGKYIDALESNSEDNDATIKSKSSSNIADDSKNSSNNIIKNNRIPTDKSIKGNLNKEDSFLYLKSLMEDIDNKNLTQELTKSKKVSNTSELRKHGVEKNSLLKDNNSSPSIKGPSSVSSENITYLDNLMKRVNYKAEKKADLKNKKKENIISNQVENDILNYEIPTSNINIEDLDFLNEQDDMMIGEYNTVLNSIKDDKENKLKKIDLVQSESLSDDEEIEKILNSDLFFKSDESKFKTDKSDESKFKTDKSDELKVKIEVNEIKEKSLTDATDEEKELVNTDVILEFEKLEKELNSEDIEDTLDDLKERLDNSNFVKDRSNIISNSLDSKLIDKKEAITKENINSSILEDENKLNQSQKNSEYDKSKEIKNNKELKKENKKIKNKKRSKSNQIIQNGIPNYRYMSDYIKNYHRVSFSLFVIFIFSNLFTLFTYSSYRRNKYKFFVRYSLLEALRNSKGSLSSEEANLFLPYPKKNPFLGPFWILVSICSLMIVPILFSKLFHNVNAKIISKLVEKERN